MVQDVRTNGGMNSRSECNIQLGANAIVASPQNRAAKSFPRHRGDTPLHRVGGRNIHSSIGIAHWKNLLSEGDEVDLENVKQASPTHLTRMDDGVEISFKAFANVPGLPDVFGSVDGHVNHQRRTDNIFARNEAPISAVVRIFAIVTHHEVIACRNLVRPTILLRMGRVRPIRLRQRVPVDVNNALLDFDGVAGKPNRALDEIRETLFRQRSAEYDNLLTLRVTPQRYMNIGERNSSVVADARNDQVISDQNGIFHGAARNHAGLH